MNVIDNISTHRAEYDHAIDAARNLNMALNTRSFKMSLRSIVLVLFAVLS